MNYTFANSIDNNCTLEITETICIINVDRCSDCDCDQIKREYVQCAAWMRADVLAFEITQKYLNITFLSLGVVTNTLLFLTLMRRRFRDSAAFVYIRIISLMALALAVFQFAAKILSDYTRVTSVSNSATIYVYSLEYLADCIKLTISTLSTFLCCDRLLSIAKPVWYRTHSKNRYVLVPLVLSTAVGCLGLVYMPRIQFEYDELTLSYAVTSINEPHRVYVERCVVWIRISEAILMTAFSVVIIVRLKHRARQLRSCVVDETALFEQKRTNNLCKFQILETFVAVLEIVMLCFVDVVGMVQESDDDNDASQPHLHKDFSSRFIYSQLGDVGVILKTMAFQLSQFLLFFLYLTFSRMFRQGFLDTFRCRRRVFRTKIGVGAGD